MFAQEYNQVSTQSEGKTTGTHSDKLFIAIENIVNCAITTSVCEYPNRVNYNSGSCTAFMLEKIDILSISMALAQKDHKRSKPYINPMVF